MQSSLRFSFRRTRRTDTGGAVGASGVTEKRGQRMRAPRVRRIGQSNISMRAVEHGRTAHQCAALQAASPTALRARGVRVVRSALSRRNRWRWVRFSARTRSAHDLEERLEHPIRHSQSRSCSGPRSTHHNFYDWPLYSKMNVVVPSSRASVARRPRASRRPRHWA